MFSIVVFAHNEEEHISKAIMAIIGQEELDENDRILVIENGSSDKTAQTVREISQDYPSVELHRITLGDKANAWCHYTFNISRHIPAAGHIFLDGDVVMRPGSLKSLREAFESFPKALAFSALPYGGRTAKKWRSRVLKEHGMPGNFYALTDSTIERIRSEKWCLPVGYIGDDTFLQWLLKRHLVPTSTVDKTAIQPVENAGFDYESIPRNSLSGIYNLYKRQRTYAMRDIQTKLLSDYLLSKASNRPPRDIAELYPNARPSTALFGPFGKLTPITIRKLMFLYTYLRTRRTPFRNGPSWYQLSEYHDMQRHHP